MSSTIGVLKRVGVGQRNLPFKILRNAHSRARDQLNGKMELPTSNTLQTHVSVEKGEARQSQHASFNNRRSSTENTMANLSQDLPSRDKLQLFTHLLLHSFITLWSALAASSAFSFAI
jgi:hypothetical protein